MHDHQTGISGRMVFLFAAACGLSAANLYYAQPVLVNIAHSFHTTPGTASLLVTCAQVGYAIGLALLVPLGDLLPRRKLIPGVLTMTALALTVAAAAPGLAPLAAVTVIFGLGSVAAQMIVPLAASLAPEERRGHVVGMVMSGLLLGILLARTASGLIANALSWRATYVIAAAITLLLAALLWRAVPPESPRPRLSYPALLASTLKLMRDESVLRRRSLLGGLNFAAFSIFWTTITFHLAGGPFHYSAGTIGLFGLVGAAGAVVANFAGRWADRDLHHLTSGVFVACIVASFAVFWIWPDNLAALLIAIVVFDIGIQGAQITNQAIIYRLHPDLRSRINAGYMVSYFIGGAMGSAVGGAVYSSYQWTGVCALGVSVSAIAAATAAWDAACERRMATAIGATN
jgi:predicted MFS family arabinose efflux permease